MRAILAVALALIVFVVGWFLLAGLLVGILYAASAAREGVGPLHLIHLVLTWVFAPGFGGFCATYVPPQVIKGVAPDTVAISFISVVITLWVLMILLPAIRGAGIATGPLLLLVAQFAAVIIGARIGWAVARTAGMLTTQPPPSSH